MIDQIHNNVSTLQAKNRKRLTFVVVFVVIVGGITPFIILAIISNNRVKNLYMQYDGQPLDGGTDNLVSIVDTRLDYTEQQLGFWGTTSLHHMNANYICVGLSCTLDTVTVTTLVLPRIYFPLQETYRSYPFYRITFDEFRERISPGDLFLSTVELNNPEWGDFDITPDQIFEIVFNDPVIMSSVNLEGELSMWITWGAPWEGNWCVQIDQVDEHLTLEVDRYNGEITDISGSFARCF